MARVILKNELKETGTGWMELYWTKEDGIKEADKALFEIAWAQWNSIEIDSKGRAAMGLTKPDESYNRFDGWRIWDAKPTCEERELVKWDET